MSSAMTSPRASKAFSLANATPTRSWRLLPLAFALLLGACESPIHNARTQRFGAADAPLPAPSVQARALALGLQTSPDGRGLSSEALVQANTLLTNQGRLSAQSLSITPLNARGQQLAPRLAAALVRSGARNPHIEPLPTDEKRLADAKAAGWDLELQSEALVRTSTRCSLAGSADWTIHPFEGVGRLGCANQENLARMASDPRDLNRPRVLEGADGRAAAGAVERYQSGDIRDLIDIDFGD